MEELLRKHALEGRMTAGKVAQLAKPKLGQKPLSKEALEAQGARLLADLAARHAAELAELTERLARSALADAAAGDAAAGAVGDDDDAAAAAAAGVTTPPPTAAVGSPATAAAGVAAAPVASQPAANGAASDAAAAAAAAEGDGKKKSRKDRRKVRRHAHCGTVAGSCWRRPPAQCRPLPLPRRAGLARSHANARSLAAGLQCAPPRRLAHARIPTRDCRTRRPRSARATRMTSARRAAVLAAAAAAAGRTPRSWRPARSSASSRRWGWTSSPCRRTATACFGCVCGGAVCGGARALTVRRRQPGLCGWGVEAGQAPDWLPHLSAAPPRPPPPPSLAAPQAVSDQLHRLATVGGAPAAAVPDHTTLRARAAEHIRAHADAFAPFLPYEPADGYPEGVQPDPGAARRAVGRYCARLAGSSAWGGHPELRALSCTLGLPLRVFQAGAPPLELTPEHESMAGRAPRGAGDGEGDDGGYAAALRQRPSAVMGDGRLLLQLTFHRSYYTLGEHYNSVVPRSALR